MATECLWRRSLLDPRRFYMSLDNSFKTVLAECIIRPVHYASWLYNKVTGKRHGHKHHYYLMNLFRTLRNPYFVTTTCSNPLDRKKKLTWKLDLSQNTQQWLYRSRGYYELPWMRLLHLGLSECSCFVDVGAHIGVFALTLAQVWPTRRVVAIEPLPANYELLISQVHLNHLENIETVQAAVANQTGKVQFYVNPLNEGGGSLLPSECYQTGGIHLDTKQYQKEHSGFVPFHPVQTTRLDDLLTSKSVIKIDVEGSEMDVLTSAEHSFKKGWIAMVVMEVGDKATAEALDWFDSRDFDCFTLGSRQPLKKNGDWGSRIGYGGRMLVCLPCGSALYHKIPWEG